MKKLVILPLVFAATTMFSQCYKKVENEVTAKYRVYITKNISQATILGYQVNTPGEVLKPGLVYFAPLYYKAATPVFIVNDPKKADIIIYWVDSKDKAMWKK